MLVILFIIAVVVIAVIFGSSADSKSDKQIAKNNASIAQLPNINLRAHELTTAQKVINFWPTDDDLLQIFSYTSSTKSIYLKMKDGRSISCPLSSLDVGFDKVNGLYRLECKYGSMKFSFYGYDYVFTDKEYEVIYNVLLLAGTTRNSGIMGSAYKITSKANTVLKVIKALS